MTVRYKKLNPDAIAPYRGSEHAAGYDLFACPETDTVVIEAGKTAKIGTGLALEIPEGYFGAIFARSGLATKQGLRPANCVGVADSDYRGEYIVALHNDSDTAQTVRKGDRIAQLVILPYLCAEFIPSDSLCETERGNGGFGSTGK